GPRSQLGGSPPSLGGMSESPRRGGREATRSVYLRGAPGNLSRRHGGFSPRRHGHDRRTPSHIKQCSSRSIAALRSTAFGSVQPPSAPFNPLLCPPPRARGRMNADARPRERFERLELLEP